MDWEPEWTIHKMRDTLTKSDEAVRRALIVLYKHQTEEERLENQTIERNNLGFNLIDAPFGSSLAKKILNGSRLSDLELTLARKMLRKYTRQLTELQNAGVRAYERR